MARTVEDIETEIAQLPQPQLKQFREWYEKFDSDAWDRQIEEDISLGKLDALADAALAEHKAGKSKRL
jgi:hypothetical protein